jgi:antitoxin ChpS
VSHQAKLRKVGGSVMLAIPPALLEELAVGADDPVELSVESARLIVEPRVRRRYSLDELLEQCNPRAPLPTDDAEWTAGGPVGRELL